MNAILAVAVATFVIIVAAWLADRKWRVGILWREALMQFKWKGPLPYKEIVEDPLPTAACVDFGAFQRPIQNLEGIKTVVLMLDRAANGWFLSYESYYSNEKVPLNAHGPLAFYQTQTDLKELIEALHQQGIKVLIGFWAFWGDFFHQPSKWMLAHPKLRPRKRDESDIGDLFVDINAEESPLFMNWSLSEYIADKYTQVHTDFNFNGLFLGDGFCGSRAFPHPERYRDQANTADKWANFYRCIAEAVHQTGGELWAYDCMGFSYNEARLHGADYQFLTNAGLDKLVFQSYPTAWTEKFFRVPGKIGLEQDLEHFSTIREALSKTHIQLYYTLEIGDRVEGWWPTWQSTREQMKAFGGKHWMKKPADGKLLVWGNDSIARHQ